MNKSLLNPLYREWTWIAGENGKPGVVGDLTNGSEVIRAIADPAVQLLGTGVVSSNTSFNAEGGINIITAGANDDQTILVPHELTNANLLHPDRMTWDADRETEFECMVVTPAATTLQLLQFGFKTDNSPVTMAITDAFMVMFEFNTDDGDTNWKLHSDTNATGNVDLDTGVVVSVNTPYKFGLKCDHAGTIHGYINDVEVGAVTGGVSADTWIPMIGVQALDAASTVETSPGLRVLGWRVTRKYGASN